MPDDDYDARYRAAAHAMQTGVAMGMELAPGASATSPKHLRVGINSAMVTDLALAKLLIAKGVITEAEYRLAIAEAMEVEKARYEAALSALLGKKVTLG
jgi:hypothetical protein